MIRTLTRQLAERQEQRSCLAELRLERARQRAPSATAPLLPAPGMEPRLRRRLRIAAWTGVAAGGAAVVAGAVLGGVAVSRPDDYNRAVAAGGPFGELEDRKREVRTLSGVSWPMVLAGAAVGVAGGSLLLWDWLDRRGRERRVTWRGASVAGRF